MRHLPLRVACLSRVSALSGHMRQSWKQDWLWYCRACPFLWGSIPQRPAYEASALPTRPKMLLRLRKTDALLYTRVRVFMLPDLASAIASVALKATSTFPKSRWFGLSARGCEQRPVCALLSRRRPSGTLDSRYTRRSDVNAATRCPCFVLVLAATVCGSHWLLAQGIKAGRCSVFL